MSSLNRRTKVLAILLVVTTISFAQEAPRSSCVPASSATRKTPQAAPINLQQGPIELHCGSQTVTEAQSVAEPKPMQPLTPLQWIDGLAKLSSSLAWPLVGLIVILTFRRQFGELIERIKSIEVGKNKVVLDAQLKPTPAPQQAAKSRDESQETDQGSVSGTTPPLNATPQTKYLLAEDLALRALQEEYGASIRRQVTAGADPGFDGAFVIDNRLYIVEVKYFRSSFLPDKLQASLYKLAASIHRYGWSNVQIILAAVFEELEDVDKKTMRLSKAVSVCSIPVIVRTFSMAELSAKFGVQPSTDG